MMIVRIADSDTSVGKGLPFSFVSNAEELDAEDDEGKFIGDIQIAGELTSTGSAYRINGEITCEREFVCDRCLRTFRQKQHHSFDEEISLEDEGKDACSENGKAVDITGLVRDTLLAAQPLAHICRPDCRGLCPKCGADLNETECGCDTFVPDPRLRALEQLLKKE